MPRAASDKNILMDLSKGPPNAGADQGLKETGVLAEAQGQTHTIPVKKMVNIWQT